MSRVPSRSTRGARATAASPAVAGFRPASAALAVAAAFAVHAGNLQAQPVPIGAVHGTASFTRNGSNLLVTTTNGAGTGHSAIDWRSFSVPGGSVTHFQQPTAASTSINRVLGPDPSAIFGTLSSNGRMVLVNPAGITVGKGALVDTAAFTAMTLRMSDADALAGRIAGTGDGAGVLQVDGHVIARSGDVVLIGSKVQTGSDAVVQADGAVVLAAGQKAELTGRGLEGIHLEVQAGNEAVNLGTLKGDAVGIFANTLRHSGLVQAQAVTSEGGRVVLKATGGDAYVSGTIVAAGADGKGGRIDVLGERVGLMAGAQVQASGALGGGQVRVGGDYQGQNASVPNAQAVYVDAQARIEADATQQGDGGRVIVWSDDVTRMHGQISARGGAAGGNGGFAEVSGKQYLEFTGGADLRAPAGTAGTLLLDPNDIVIEVLGPTQTSTGNVFAGGTGQSKIKESDLEQQLALSSVIVSTDAGSGGTGNITVADGVNIAWSTANTLGLQADGGIDFQGSITATDPNAVLSLHTLTVPGGAITQNAATSVINVAKLQINADNGSVSLNGVNRIGTVAAQTAGSANSFSLVNAQSLTIGSVSSPYGFARSGISTESGTNAGAINIKVTSGSLDVQQAVTGGNVVLETTAVGGDISVSSTVWALTGGITVDARGSISGGGVYSTNGGAAGNVRLQARGGDAVFGSIYTYAVAPGIQGGNVDVVAAGTIKGFFDGFSEYFYIDASGAFGAAGGVGGNGGTVSLNLGGSLGAGQVYAQGGSGGDGSGTTTGNGGTGGNGGKISVSHTSGNMVLGDVYLSVDAGSGGWADSTKGSGGMGGNGGQIVVSAPGNLTLSATSLSAYRGFGGYSSTAGTYAADGAMGTASLTGKVVDVSSYLWVGADWQNNGTLNILDASSVGGDGVFQNKGVVNLFGSASLDNNTGVQNFGLVKAVSGTPTLFLAQNAGTVEVAPGATLFAPAFTSNDGVLKVDGVLDLAPSYVRGCTCEVITTALLPIAPSTLPFTNQAGGTLTGSGSIVVDGGIGIIDNFGAISPAGVGSAGTLMLDASLLMRGGSTYAADILDGSTHDTLQVTGSVATGGNVLVNFLPGASFPVGQTFTILQSGSLDASTLPAVSQPALAPVVSGNNLLLAAVAPFPVIPSAPITEPLPTEEVTNQVTTFATLFLQEAQAQQEEEAKDNAIGKDDIVITETACK